MNHLADAPPPPDAAIDAAPPANPVSLDVSMGGSGSGTITSSPAGISCGATCTAEFEKNTLVTLTAVPATGSVFTSWGGACSGTVPTCEVTLADAKNVSATFDVAKYTVTVTRSGAGMGTVTGDGVSCGSTCSIVVDHGTMISLAATPGTLSVFAGWGGACSGTASCDVTVTADTAISANFALDNLTLFVTAGGNGAGTVTSAPAGINCGADCSETYVANQVITLTAAPSTGSTFTGWSGGGCTGIGTCMVTMTAATTVTATFTLDTHDLTVTKDGTGSGSVVSTPAGIACGSDCTETYDYNTMVTLTATASTGSTFTGWSGACSGTGPCMVTMTQARAVTATFTLDLHTLTVTPMGTGAGTITGTGIACGSDCMETYPFGTMVTLTAAPSAGSSFGGWGGACAGAGAATTCTVTMDMARAVTATFTLGTNALTVGLAGNGSGTVTGPGINCGTDCSEIVGFGTMVTLAAAASTGSTFTGWSGACSGTGACTVTMDMAQSVTATFTLDKFLLTVGTSGTGQGQVSGTGIDCGFVTSDCTENIDYGTMVTLTATPATGSTFSGWSGGGCSGTGPCTVTVTAASTVTAMFTINTYNLMVTKNGTGTGTVTATGISCGADCSELYDFNTMVTLTATPSVSSSFAGWSGACTGLGSCTVTMTQARNVTATFNLKTFTFSVTRSGTGTGTITGGGLNCGATCSITVSYGGSVTLAQTPSTANATASTFNGWSGAGCLGTGGCTVSNITANTTVDAKYTLKPNIMFVTTSTHTGDLGGLGGADSICKARASTAGLPGNYVAYLGSPSGSAPSRVGAASGWVRVDGAPVINAISEFAAGTMFNAPSLMENNMNVTVSMNVNVWTATSTPSGAYAGSVCLPASGANLPWQGASGSAVWGNATTASSKAVLASGGASCANLAHLYCFGTDRAAIAQ